VCEGRNVEGASEAPRMVVADVPDWQWMHYMIYNLALPREEDLYRSRKVL